MKHDMGLYETPFNSMKAGKKKVEVRLYDEKRRKISVGDTITFTKIPGRNEALTVEVLEMKQFPTFKEMYENIPASDLDAVGGSIGEMVDNTYHIYTPEREMVWGTVAITIKVLE